jgi:DNA polymerase-1
MPVATRPTSPTLFLVDGYALVYRAFFALLSRPLRTAKGENTSAAWGVVNFVQRLLDKHKPDYLAWVHDAGSSFRHEVYADYKATREKLTDELQADFDQGLQRIDELLDAFRVRVITIQGYEADDVIGTLTTQAVAAGVNAVIVSGDKDFQQLVKSGVWLLNPGRGGPASVEEQWVSVETADERLGIPPRFVTDYLAMLGDTSDNVLGVPGIGEKTAQELINAYGDLDAILANVGAITKKRPREALIQFREQAYLSKKLVTIRDDVPVTLDLDSLRISEPDSARLRRLFVDLEFSTLLKTLEDPRSLPSPSGPTESFRLISTVAEVERLVEELRAAPIIALACATTGDADGENPVRSRLVGLAVSAERGARYYLPFAHRAWSPQQPDLLTGTSLESTGPDGESLVAQALRRGDRVAQNLPSLDSDALVPLRRLLEDPGVAKATKHAKLEKLALRNLGVFVRGVTFDVTLASYVLDPNRRSHGLGLLAFELLERSLHSPESLLGKGRSELSFEAAPADLARDVMCAEVDTVFRLRDAMLPRLRSADGERLLSDIELPLVDVLADMEWTGVAIDIPWFRSLKTRFQAERERVERAIHVSAGEAFNINSNPQLRAILFEKLRLPIRKKTATGPSTDASVLQELADEGHELPALLMEYREISKLESTYLDTLPELVLPRDQRLHTTYSQTVAATGRLSSHDPNLQNIPIRRELGRDIRRGFVPQSGWKFLAADYSQIELRLLAHLSEDPAFVEAFVSGGDIHRQTAAIIFGLPIAEVNSEMRARAKTINFATIYGQGANALSRQLKITNQEARDFIATYFERFKGVRSYLDSMVAFARDHGYVKTIFHRRRYIPELRERNFNVRAFGERVAANAPIQGSAADLIKIAMIRIHHSLLESRMSSRMILQVHDELVFEGPDDEMQSLENVVRREMEGAATLIVPLVVDVGVGDNWLDAKA